nr:J433 [uncultured bacterium]
MRSIVENGPKVNAERPDLRQTVAILFLALDKERHAPTARA